MANYLEQLVAEWYEYQGYFVRKNVLVGKRKKGGYEGELDVVAFHPEKFHLVHIEPSMDTYTWEVRENNYQKKFKNGKIYIPKLFAGMKIPVNIEQIALFGFIGKKHPQSIAGGKIVTIMEFLKEICYKTKNNTSGKNIIPEQFPVLRTIMFISENRKDIYQDL